MPKATTARDYFGDLSKHVASPEVEAEDTANPLDAVKKALRRDAEADDLTPKAARA